MKIYKLDYRLYRLLKKTNSVVCRSCRYLLRVGDIVVRVKDTKRRAVIRHQQCYVDAHNEPYYAETLAEKRP